MHLPARFVRNANFVPELEQPDLMFRKKVIVGRVVLDIGCQGYARVVIHKAFHCQESTRVLSNPENEAVETNPDSARSRTAKAVTSIDTEMAIDADDLLDLPAGMHGH